MKAETETLVKTDPNLGIQFRNLTPVLVRLLRGPLFSDDHAQAWSTLLLYRNDLSHYFDVLGLDIRVDEGEGFAYLRQREAEDGEEVPRLIPRRALSFHTSILCALLRKKLLEFDTFKGGARAVLSREEIHQMISIYFQETANEVKRKAEIDRHIHKVEEMGLLRIFPDQKDRLEIRRVIKAVIDPEWLSKFEQKLENRGEQ